jgi:hypothetical protein
MKGLIATVCLLFPVSLCLAAPAEALCAVPKPAEIAPVEAGPTPSAETAQPAHPIRDKCTKAARQTLRVITAPVTIPIEFVALWWALSH